MAKNRIKELRNSTNPKITLKGLSEKLKEKGLSFTDSQLSKFENGTSTPRNEDIWEALAEIFDTSVYYLIGYDAMDKKQLQEFLDNVKAQTNRLSDKYKEDIGKDKPTIKELKKYAGAKIEEEKFKEIFYNLTEGNRDKWLNYGKDLSKLQDFEKKIKN